jgi:hypothetical protein
MDERVIFKIIVFSSNDIQPFLKRGVFIFFAYPIINLLKGR